MAGRTRIKQSLASKAGEKLEFRIQKNLKHNYLIILGILLISTFLVWRYYQARILSFNTSEVSKIDTTEVTPVHIKAYPIGIDVDIKPAIITNGVWPVFPNTAGFVMNGKNIIIYGHNKDNILGPIRYIKTGTKIEILGSDNNKYFYEVTKTDIVDPDNLEYIKPKSIETLTIYTCTGFLDSKRFIVVAEKLD